MQFTPPKVCRHHPIQILLLCFVTILGFAEGAPDFTVKLETVMKHDDSQFLWFHPRAAAIPGDEQSSPAVVMTIQKHLKVSDYYSGLHVMTRTNLNASWAGPVLPPELDWLKESNGVTISVADVTPGWHAPSGKLLAIGCQVRYSPKGEQLDDVIRAHQTVYAVFDPKTKHWSRWRVLELPTDEQFNFARNTPARNGSSKPMDICSCHSTSDETPANRSALPWLNVASTARS